MEMVLFQINNTSLGFFLPALCLHYEFTKIIQQKHIIQKVLTYLNSKQNQLARVRLLLGIFVFPHKSIFA